MWAQKYVLYSLTAGIFLTLIYQFLSWAGQGHFHLEKILNFEKLDDLKEGIDRKSLLTQIPHLHLDLFTRNLTLINITNFQFIINNEICNITTISLVIIVHSAPHNIHLRNMIRNSWGVPNMLNVVTRLVFLLGVPQDEEAQGHIDAENAAYKDLVQGQFSDTYANLSYKNIMGKLWVSEYCEQAEFVVKTDDDIYVNIYEVYNITRSYINANHFQRNKFLLGYVIRGMPIKRDPSSKWYVSYADLAKDESAKEGPELYPTYCSGQGLRKLYFPRSSTY